MICQARLHVRLIEGPGGWPEYEYGGACTQSVGVGRWWDALDIERAACSLPGHRADVVAQSAADELRERVRHDVEREARPPITAADWQGIRPEMAGRLS